MSIKLTHEFVYNYYLNEKYIMNSIYKNYMNKDKLSCPIGHEIEMTFSNFKQGKRCSICSGNKKLTQRFVFDYYAKYNYTLKSIYKNYMNKDELICPVGHEIKMKFNNFKQGSRCRKCYELNNIGENHPTYKKDRTRQSRSEYLKFNRTKIYILVDEPLYKNYIQSQNKAKISDKNWDRTEYTVDHIQPRIAFIDNNLDILYDKKLIKEICNSRDNLRIISQKDNGSKLGKYNQEEFINWFNQKLEKYNETSKNNIE